MARLRQVWTTTTNNEQIVIPVCPGDYFGPGYDDLKLDITWGDGTGVESIVHTATDNTVAYALRHTFTSPGDHEVYMTGGWSDDPNRSVLNNSRLLAYATEADRPADTTPGKLKHWYQHNVSGGKYRDRLQGWQKDDDGNPLQGERGVEIVSVSKFYLAGEGTFKDFTLMDNFPMGVEPLYSADPTTNIQLDPTGTIRMDETFMNCGSLIGGNIWSFKSQGHRGVNKITSAARCFKNALAPVSTDYQRQFTVGQETEQTTYINADGETVIETTIINPGVKQWAPAAGTSGTREVFKIWAWGMANCTDFTEMFDNCGAKVIDISRWDTSSGVHFDRMFKDCSFERLKLGLNGKTNSNINMISAETMNGMFDNCQFEQLKYHAPPGHRNYNKNYPREEHQKDFPLLDTGNVTDFDDCFRDSNFNTDISGWDVRKATTFEDFRDGGALIDDHTPRFVYPVADIEVVDLTGDQSAQQMTVSLENTTRWEWKMNDQAFVQQTDETVVDLSGVEEGLNTLTLHAYNVADQLSDIEVSFIWVLGFGDHCADDDGTAVLLWDDSDTWDDTKKWQETGQPASTPATPSSDDTYTGSECDIFDSLVATGPDGGPTDYLVPWIYSALHLMPRDGGGLDDATIDKLLNFLNQPSGIDQLSENYKRFVTITNADGTMREEWWPVDDWIKMSLAEDVLGNPGPFNGIRVGSVGQRQWNRDGVGVEWYKLNHPTESVRNSQVGMHVTVEGCPGASAHFPHVGNAQATYDLSHGTNFVLQGTTDNFQAIEAPFVPSSNGGGVSGAYYTWPQSVNGSYWQPTTGYFGSSTHGSAQLGNSWTAENGGYKLWNIASLFTDNIWTASNDDSTNPQRFGFWAAIAQYKMWKQMNLVDGSPIDLNNFTARIVRWDSSIDFRLRERWLISSDFSLATYYCVENPTYVRTSDFEQSVRPVTTHEVQIFELDDTRFLYGDSQGSQGFRLQIGADEYGHGRWPWDGALNYLTQLSKSASPVTVSQQGTDRAASAYLYDQLIPINIYHRYTNGNKGDLLSDTHNIKYVTDPQAIGTGTGYTFLFDKVLPSSINSYIVEVPAY